MNELKNQEEEEEEELYNRVVVPLLTQRMRVVDAARLENDAAVGERGRVVAQVVLAQLVRLAELEYLIDADLVARVRACVVALDAPQQVKAQVVLYIQYLCSLIKKIVNFDFITSLVFLSNEKKKINLADVIEVNGHGRLRIDVLQVPAKGLALQPLAQLDAFAEVARVEAAHAGQDAAEEDAILVGPHVDDASHVAREHLVGELVRR